MNIASDPKLAPPAPCSRRRPTRRPRCATATGVLTVDLDAIVANWRKLEKTAVPAECAGVIKAERLWLRRRTGRARAGRRRLQDVFRRHAGRSARRPRGGAGGGDLCARRLFPEQRRAYAKIDARPVIGDLNELAEWDVFCRRSGWAGGAAIHIDTGMNRLGLTLDRGAGHRSRGSMPAITASRW